MNKPAILATLLALTACAHVPPPRDLICNGPRQNIADNDPALRLFEGSLEDRKVALADERINGCEGGGR